MERDKKDGAMAKFRKSIFNKAPEEAPVPTEETREDILAQLHDDGDEDSDEDEPSTADFAAELMRTKTAADLVTQKSSAGDGPKDKEADSDDSGEDDAADMAKIMNQAKDLQEKGKQAPTEKSGQVEAEKLQSSAGKVAENPYAEEEQRFK